MLPDCFMPYISADTIAARVTPAGSAGIGVIRVSGPQAISIADRLFSPAGSVTPSTAASHTLLHGWIISDGKPVDEVLLSILRAPRSYTAEDTIEISAHGGAVVLSRILELCHAAGARPAEPGEFTCRAFLNGKLDLAQAEAVAALIAAKTTLSAAAAARQLQGGLSRRIQDWRQRLLHLLSGFEAALDHAEEEIAFITPGEATAEIAALRTALAALIATANRGKQLREGLSVALIGKPNTGKSSLLNALLERERAIVTDIPGTTRDSIEETLDLDGLPLIVTDTAGLRESTTDPVEKIGHQRTAAAMDSAGLILWLVEAPGPLDTDDRAIAALLHSRGYAAKTIIVKNKIDAGSCITDEELRQLLPAAAGHCALSAATREGITALETGIRSCVHSTELSADEPLVASTRHAEALRQADAALAATADAITLAAGDEITAFHLREALDALGCITGETAPAEILDQIFSRFCIGK
jgi:tRNA modification GTPase